MFVYLDESGDTGFKFNKGSSRYFVVTILLTPDPLPLNTAIDDLRSSLNFRPDHEFKFYNTRPVDRLAFLRVLNRHEVLFRALVVDKHELTRPHMRDREVFYNYLLKMLLKYDNQRIQDATLIIDQRDKGKKSKQSLATYLRRGLNNEINGYGKIKAIRYHESRRDNLIQAVDMVAGSIHTKCRDGNHQYCQIIRTKLDDIWHLHPYDAQ